MAYPPGGTFGTQPLPAPHDWGARFELTQLEPETIDVQLSERRRAGVRLPRVDAGRQMAQPAVRRARSVRLDRTGRMLSGEDKSHVRDTREKKPLPSFADNAKLEIVDWPLRGELRS